MVLSLATRKDLNGDGDDQQPATGPQHHWLPTDGHVLGTIFWRILLPESEPGDIRCAVITLGK